jgi:hypothetical protein
MKKMRGTKNTSADYFLKVPKVLDSKALGEYVRGPDLSKNGFLEFS